MAWVRILPGMVVIAQVLVNAPLWAWIVGACLYGVRGGLLGVRRTARPLAIRIVVFICLLVLIDHITNRMGACLVGAVSVAAVVMFLVVSVRGLPCGNGRHRARWCWRGAAPGAFLGLFAGAILWGVFTMGMARVPMLEGLLKGLLEYLLEGILGLWRFIGNG